MVESQLENNPFFRNIDKHSINDLINSGRIKIFEKGCLIFSRQDEIKYFYIIISGWVKIYRETFDGQEVVLDLVRNGDIITESNDIDNKHTFNAQAINNVKLLKFTQAKLKEILETDKILALKIISGLKSFINRLELQVEHNITMNAAQRISCFIIRLCNNKLEGTMKIQLPFDKMLIASCLGMKRETFSRALKDLTAFGVTIEGKVVLIKDLKKLIKLSCVSCSLSPEYCNKIL